MTQNLKKQIFSYSIFQLVCWLVYMLILSLSTFFHFLLNHRLGVIEDWLFEFSWQLICLAKFIAFATMITFHTIKFDVGNPLVSFFYEGNKSITTREVKLIFFIFCTLIIFGRYESNAAFNFYKVFASYTSTILFFIFDILFLSLLQLTWPLQGKDRKNSSNIFSVIFVLGGKLFFFYEYTQAFIFLIHIFIILNLTLKVELNWSRPLLYLLMITGPITSIIGIDPMWGNKFSLLGAYLGQNLIFLYTILCIGFGYINMTYFKEALKTTGVTGGSK